MSSACNRDRAWLCAPLLEPRSSCAVLAWPLSVFIYWIHQTSINSCVRRYTCSSYVARQLYIFTTNQVRIVWRLENVVSFTPKKIKTLEMIVICMVDEDRECNNVWDWHHCIRLGAYVYLINGNSNVYCVQNSYYELIIKPGLDLKKTTLTQELRPKRFYS